MALRFARPESKRARIELVPMIDTMAFLLIFFMIASLAMSKQMGFPVSLPRAQSAVEQTWADRALVITLSARGELHLDRRPIPFSALGRELRRRLEKRPDLVVVINADGKLAHEQVIRVMDEAKGAGAARMAIATRPTEKAGPER